MQPFLGEAIASQAPQDLHLSPWGLLHSWPLAGCSVPGLVLPNSFRQLKTVDGVQRIRKQPEFLSLQGPCKKIQLFEGRVGAGVIQKGPRVFPTCGVLPAAWELLPRSS